jgi:hypothetical protein
MGKKFMPKLQAAQNQHYVPKFILRHFLSDRTKKQVTVFQKSTTKRFKTSIDRVMAERRFNEFQIDEDFYASFEDSICRVEEAVLPVYENLVRNQRLTGTGEEKTTLGVFIAFQMLRTRAYRDVQTSLLSQLRDKFTQMGFSPEHMEGLEEPTEDEQKRSHLVSMRKSINEFSSIIAIKDFVLLRAAEGRHFYLGDNPVVLHNDIERKGVWGNIGLSVKGIQIYVPLTSKLLLAAWCPSILGEYRENASHHRAQQRRVKATVALSPQPFPTAQLAALRHEMVKLDEGLVRIEQYLRFADEGRPVQMTTDNMDFYNSMQVEYAREFIVCQNGDFDLARRFVAERGAGGGGFPFRVG